MGEASDTVIWNYAIEQNTVLITKDEDFVIRLSMNQNGPTVIWIRIGNVGKQALLQWFEPMLPRITEEVNSGEKLIELI